MRLQEFKIETEDEHNSRLQVLRENTSNIREEETEAQRVRRTETARQNSARCRQQLVLVKTTRQPLQRTIPYTWMDGFRAAFAPATVG